MKKLVLLVLITLLIVAPTIYVPNTYKVVEVPFYATDIIIERVEVLDVKQTTQNVHVKIEGNFTLVFFCSGEGTCYEGTGLMLSVVGVENVEFIATNGDVIIDYSWYPEPKRTYLPVTIR